MIEDGPGHLDERGEPCATHPQIRPEAMLLLALVGTRATGLNHDLASKLQGLLMTLEDLAERLGERGEADLARAATEASTSAQDLVEIVTASRALTRQPGPSRQTLRELVAASCQRAGIELTAELVDAEIEIIAPHVVHALALVIEVAGGLGRGRPLESSCRHVNDGVELVLTAAPRTTSYASEYLALAGAVLRRSGGDLRCGPSRITVWLPIRPARVSTPALSGAAGGPSGGGSGGSGGSSGSSSGDAQGA